MRSDVTLYVVAAFFFVLTIASAVIFQQEERSLWMITTAVIGILSLSLGIYQRPKTKTTTTQKMQTVSQSTQQEETNSQTETIQTETPIEQAPITETVATETSQTIETPTEPAEPEMPKEEKPAVNVAQTETVSVEQAAPLTNVKGIGEKRAAQLNALGINTAEELANASVDELAKNLKVSPKIVAKWVEAAKQ